MRGRLRNALAVAAAVALGSAGALAAPLVTGQLTQAGAADEYVACSSAAIETAIYNATGQHTGQNTSAGLACNPYLYNDGRWDSASELQGHVNEVLGRCGSNDKLLVLALLEVTGQPPQRPVSGVEDHVCDRNVYEAWWNDTKSYTSPGVDWTKYSSNAYPSINVWNAVHGTMSVCHISEISHAVVSVTGRYPVRETGVTARPTPNLFVPKALGAKGQCDPGLYRNGVWSSYTDLRTRVAERAGSTASCGDAWITQGYQDMTGWRPLAEECEAWRYGNGSWGNQQELVNRIYHSLRCWDAWMGQVYAFDIAQPRRVSGRGWSVGECSTLLYLPPGMPFLGYEDFQEKVRAVANNLAQQGVEIDSGGDVTVGGQEYDANQVLVGATQGNKSAGTLGGQVYENSLVNGLLRVTPNPGGQIIATGGGNIIATGGGNIIATGGGNIIATGGGNIIATGGGN